MRRRQFIARGIVGSAAALTGCRPEDDVAPSTSAGVDLQTAQIFDVTGGDGLLVAIEGLALLVTSDAQPKSADVGLMTYGSHEPVSGHVATLIVPRGAIADTTTAVPVAVDLHHAYYSLREMELAIVPRQTKDPGSPISYAAGVDWTTKQTSNVCAVDDADWNNIQWLLSLDELYPGATLLPGWRTQTQYVQSVVEFRYGSIEDPSLSSSDPGSNRNVRSWRLRGTVERALKEILRVLFSSKSFFHLTLTPYSGSGNTAVVVNGDGQRAAIGIVNLPVSTGGMSNTLDDLQAIKNIAQMPKTPGPSPTHAGECPKQPKMRTLGCGCCPMVRTSL